MKNKLFSYQSNNFGKFLKVCGMTFALNPWGNCFSPALCMETPMLKPHMFKGIMRHGARVILTLRFKGAETKIYWRGALRVDWQSGHIARRFGKFVDTDFGGVFQYKGILGSHIDL
jgi:hypothetical protein